VPDCAPAPLAGVRVLDFSRVLAGPYCTMVLADLGAEVIKVERPGAGDETRGWGPPFQGDEAGYFLAVNRGKRSLALDLGDDRAEPALRALVQRADVVIENFRAGVADRLGLGFDALSALAPQLVYCSITGFGSAREPAGRAGYDFVVQAESGLMSITGDPEGPPAKVGVALVDVLCGLHAATGILAALRAREQTGRGRRIEVSLLDSALAGLINVAQGTLITGQEAARYGNAHPSIVPYQPFQVADGWVAVAAANDSLWQALCRALEREDLAADERLTHNRGRVEHRDELIAQLTGTFATRSVADWLGRLDAHGVPAGKIRGVHEALQAAAQAGAPATVTVQHPTAGALELVRGPIRLQPPIAGAPQPPPRLGQHTREILSEAGLDAEALIAAGVAATAR
jgi:crotonobetainyl-CoA:carnitine CoA-transferase CaiB-like acyl-CoA transferase